MARWLDRRLSGRGVTRCIDGVRADHGRTSRCQRRDRPHHPQSPRQAECLDPAHGRGASRRDHAGERGSDRWCNRDDGGRPRLLRRRRHGRDLQVAHRWRRPRQRHCGRCRRHAERSRLGRAATGEQADRVRGQRTGDRYRRHDVLGGRSDHRVERSQVRHGLHQDGLGARAGIHPAAPRTGGLRRGERPVLVGSSRHCGGGGPNRPGRPRRRARGTA